METPESPSKHPSLCFSSPKVASRPSSTDLLEKDHSQNFTSKFNVRGLWQRIRGSGSKSHGLGTYNGVLIPTCENMWGVLIFLRFFFIVGNAGVWQSFLVVFVSFFCALLTTISLSAIATNGPIEEGGTYYLISRALGPRIGGAVGCLYYLGVMLLAVLESLGAVEMMEFTFSILHFPSSSRILGAILLFILGVLVFFGIKFVSKLGVFFFLIVLYTMLSYYMGFFAAPRRHAPPTLTGLSWKTFKNNWNPMYDENVSFSVVLSVFFPCFTGILSGADRAKNLRNPEKSIPTGTLGAIFISLLMYISYMGLWAAVGTRDFLLSKNHSTHHSGNEQLMAMKEVAFPLPILTQLGIMIASISQALQCLITSPRLLQAIAGDRILSFLNFLSETTEAGEPRRALIFTTILCVLGAMVGSLDKIAPLVSICFLTCYAALNLSCFILSIMNAPSWRPKWKYYHWSFALVGFFLCAAMNFFIVWYWALVAMVVLAVIYAYIDYRQVEVDWGTGLGGLRLQLAVQSILSVGHEARYSVNWRPQLLCLSKPRSSWSIDGHAGHEFLCFASQLKKGKGLCVITIILEGNLEEMAPQLAAERVELENCMEAAKVTGFSKVLTAPTYREGKTYAIQSSGLGSLEPNTLLLGWPTKWREEGESSSEILLETLAESKAADKAVLLCMHLNQFPANDSPQEGTIDVWWIVHDGGLLLLLAHLINQHKIWRKCKLRVHTVAEKLDNSEAIKENLHKILEQVRIKAEVEVLELDDSDLAPYTFDNTIRMEAALAFAKEVADYRKKRDPGRKKISNGQKLKNMLTSKQDSTNNLLQNIFKKAFPGELMMLRGALPSKRRHGWRQKDTADKSSNEAIDVECAEAGIVDTKSSLRKSKRLDKSRDIFEQLDDRRLPDPSRIKLEEHKEGTAANNHATDIATTNHATTNHATDIETTLSHVTEWPKAIDSEFPDGKKSPDLEIVVEGRPLTFSDETKLGTPDLNTLVQDKTRKPMVRAKSAGQLPPMKNGKKQQNNSIFRTASAGQLLPVTSSGGLSAGNTPPELLPSRRTWETFSQCYSAKKLNDIIVEQSKSAQLVILNLPDHYHGMLPNKYMEYCEDLTRGLQRVLLVRGTGRELWTGTGHFD